MKPIFAAVAFGMFAIATGIAQDTATPNSANSQFPAPSNLGEISLLGNGIQRTMTLLETSTPERRNTVTILLYGQSITAGQWGARLEEHLRQKYPHANLIYLRRPLSGYSTERLVKTAEFDLYPVYADLVLFHDYGNNEDYETMIRKLRNQTTSEILIQADHFRRSEKVIDESDPATIGSTKQRWAAQRNNDFLPGLAKRYGCGFDDRRRLWADYLNEHQLDPGALVKDDVHPNDHGTYVMTELVKAYLTRRENVTIDPMNCGYVTTFLAGEDFQPSNGRIDLECFGNRIDVVFNDETTGTCDAEIDGHRPLSDPDMLYHGRNRVKWRNTPIPPGPWPPALRVRSEKPLVQEDWTLQAAKVPGDSDAYTFTLQGSVTGDDGGGRTDRDFVSDSGRVAIAADDWEIHFAIVALRRLKALPERFQLNWSVERQASDHLVPPPAEAGIGRTITVAQRIADGPHQLSLRGEVAGIRAIRVYSPQKFPRGE